MFRVAEWSFFGFGLSSQWKGEIQEFCPNTKMLLVGCKSDLRTDLSTLVELSSHRQTPVSYDQVVSQDAVLFRISPSESSLNDWGYSLISTFRMRP